MPSVITVNAPAYLNTTEILLSAVVRNVFSTRIVPAISLVCVIRVLILVPALVRLLPFAKCSTTYPTAAVPMAWKAMLL